MKPWADTMGLGRKERHPPLIPHGGILEGFALHMEENQKQTFLD